MLTAWSPCTMRVVQEREAKLVGQLKSRLEPWFGPGGREAFERGVRAEAEHLAHCQFGPEFLQVCGHSAVLGVSLCMWWSDWVCAAWARVAAGLLVPLC